MNIEVRGSTEVHRIRGSGFPFRAELLKTDALSSQATPEEVESRHGRWNRRGNISLQCFCFYPVIRYIGAFAKSP
jgi:hypothetical protein